MAPEEVCELLRTQFGDAVEETVPHGGHPYVRIAPPHWPEIARFLRDDQRLALNFLRSISALDLLADNKLACVYDLMHVPTDRGDALITNTREFAVRVVVDRDDPLIPSVSSVWPG